MSETQTIVTIEDDAEIRTIVQLVLQMEGYRVLPARNGAEGLDIVGTGGVDLILLDMHMPIMDGWQFANAYRDTAQPHVPIIVMTAAADARKAAAEISAQAYLPKPFDMGELIRLVARHLPNRRG